MSWLWKRMALETKKRAKGTDKEDNIYPEVKGIISKEEIKKRIQDIDDLVMKDVPFGERFVTVIYLSSIVDKDYVDREVFELLRRTREDTIQQVFNNSYLFKEDELPLLIKSIFKGESILMFPNRKVISVSTYGPPERSISTSEIESNILGPQDSFVESLSANLSLIKRRIRSPQLKTKQLVVGTETQNDVAILYMDNIANREHIEMTINRVKNIEFEGIIGTPLLGQIIGDKPYSIFPQFLMTTRPDQVSSYLLDGRVVVLLNGGTEALVCPSTFLEMFTTPEDSYNRWLITTFVRNLRFWGFFITIFLTSTYASVLTFHPEMLPPDLLTLLSESRARVPFPPVIEVLFMELVIDILREAGVRMPSKVGQTIGIVGGIVIGTAAVEAGLASNILIVVVAISALLSFLPTSYAMSNASRIIRYFFIIAAGIYGMYGQMLMFAFLMGHLTSLKTLGDAYMTPFPRKITDLENGIFRAPIQYIFSRMGVSQAKKELNRPLNGEE